MLSALKPPHEHPFIAKKQATLAKSLTSWRKGSALLEANFLAWYLVAVGREETARSIVDEIAANVAFAGNYNQWGPAADSICMAARFARQAGETARARALMERIVEYPAYAVGAGRDYFKGILQRNIAQLDGATDSSNTQTACKLAANALEVLTYFAETLRHGGFPYDGLAKASSLDEHIETGIAVIRGRLLGK